MLLPKETLRLWNVFKHGDWQAYTALYNQNFEANGELPDE